jgi:hypothetical protein
LDVVMVSKFFDVLFGLRRCEIRSCDLLPSVLSLEIVQSKKSSLLIFLLTQAQDQDKK